MQAEAPSDSMQSQGTKPVRIVVVDDHTLVRAGICSLLRTFSGVEVIGEAGDGLEALEVVGRLQPDLVLMDILMPRFNGLEALSRLAKEFPKIAVVIVSMNAVEQVVLQAIQAGACGYLLKNVTPAELELAIQAVARGEKYLSSGIAKQVIENFVRRLEPGPLDGLTPRQRQILKLIAEGHSNRDIASQLGISVNTVDSHRSQLMTTLDIHEVAGLVRYAIRAGLTSADL
jgi:DNA-binding NarL/FixJ family response regulator